MTAWGSADCWLLSTTVIVCTIEVSGSTVDDCDGCDNCDDCDDDDDDYDYDDGGGVGNDVA